jgi:hypothetical protein
VDPDGGQHIVLIHHDSAGLFSGEDFGQAMHTDYVGVRGYQDVGELPSFPLGAPWHID